MWMTASITKIFWWSITFVDITHFRLETAMIIRVALEKRERLVVASNNSRHKPGLNITKSQMMFIPSFVHDQAW